MESRYGLAGPDVVILSDDIAGMERKSFFRMTRSRQEAWFFAVLDGLGAAGASELAPPSPFRRKLRQKRSDLNVHPADRRSWRNIWIPLIFRPVSNTSEDVK